MPTSLLHCMCDERVWRTCMQLCLLYHCTIYSIISISLGTAIGDQQPILIPGQIAGIAIAAVTFALLFLIVVSLVICWLHIRTIHSRRPNCDGQTIQFRNVAMQSAYHRIPQSHTRPLDATNPLRAPGAHTGTQSILKSQECERKLFLYSLN